MPDSLDRSLVVGLDPGEHTGLALYDPAADRGHGLGRGVVVAVSTAAPLATLRHLRTLADDGYPTGNDGGDDVRPVTAVYIEDARSLPIYARYGKAGRGERDRIARAVGRADGLTALYAEHAEALGLTVHLSEPVRAAKWDATTFARLTGYTSRTSQHGRDAARVVIAGVGSTGGGTAATGRPLRSA